MAMALSPARSSAMSLMIAVAGFIPALAAAVLLYREIRQKTLLPVTMSAGSYRRGAGGVAGDGRDLRPARGGRAASRRSRRRVLSERSEMAVAFSIPGRAGSKPVPLAWRSLTSNKWRLFRSSAGIGFAVLLMLMQLGFEKAFFDCFAASAARARRRHFPAERPQISVCDAGSVSPPPFWRQQRPSRGWRACGRSTPTGSICSGRIRSTASRYLVRAFAFDPDDAGVSVSRRSTLRARS